MREEREWGSMIRLWSFLGNKERRKQGGGWKDGSGLRAQAAFTENQSLFPSTHIGWLIATCNMPQET